MPATPEKEDTENKRTRLLCDEVLEAGDDTTETLTWEPLTQEEDEEDYPDAFDDGQGNVIPLFLDYSVMHDYEPSPETSSSEEDGSNPTSCNHPNA